MARIAVVQFVSTILAGLCLVGCLAFHDCVQQRRRASQWRRRLVQTNTNDATTPKDCSGGLCLGMRGGPHEGGSASYPVISHGLTSMYSFMTVPDYPKNASDITYYIWTDVFFGDVGNGRMNQFVPQLLLGDVLAGSTGYPDYEPIWKNINRWMFGSHYFFELWDESKNKTIPKAAYGTLYPANVGETLYTNFTSYFETAVNKKKKLIWELTMGVVGDTSRTSRLVVDAPYMGLGRDWLVPTSSWMEHNYSRMCINACWELYGAIDRDHFPSSGALYDLYIKQANPFSFPWITHWVQDEGLNQSCGTSAVIAESHTARMQHVQWKIGI